ncbi:glycoside hydrolase family 19 protein [Pantanalinema sp. GBBB05]|uniref:glycoside hydrolase family 19 protein n=1 Tax=Pantanalinema sp. GBBB05 TaxID=2604139 RepID=UPI003D8198A5
MSQLAIWRIQAFERLVELVSKLQGAASPSDDKVDDLVRKLSQLPARPADRPAYVGIFGVKDVNAGRKKAVERLQELFVELEGDYNEVDSLIDDVIRSLTKLPKRPADKQPYASLFPPSKFNLLSVDELLAIAPEAPVERAKLLVPQLNRTMLEFEITTPRRQAHFLAQIAHESDRFRALEEYASGSDYEWRMDLGNVFPGDGVRFKGRGLIQITGRTNYGECGRALGVDLIKSPKRLSDPDLACRSAGWYWDNRKLNRDADRNDVYTITEVINGGYNGLDDRKELLVAAKRVFKA